MYVCVRPPSAKSVISNYSIIACILLSCSWLYAIYRAADGSCEGDGGVQVWPDEDVQTQAKLQDAHVWKCGCDGEAKNGWIFTHESTITTAASVMQLTI